MLVLLATLGMMMMISANDLIALYLGLELQSLALYVVAAFRRDDVRSTEAGLKYFVLGALSSGMLLYGASLIYGFTGSTGFAGIAAARTATAPAPTRPDLRPRVPAGRPRLQDLGRAVPHVDARRLRGRADAGHRLLRRRAQGRGHGAARARDARRLRRHRRRSGSRSSSSLSIASMVLGAFAAIGQTNIKRLMAYSSIGHIGYALVGLAAGTPEGVQGVIIYMAIYVVMTLGAFACILAMRRSGGMVEDIDDLAGLRADQPRHGLRAGDADVLAGRHPAARRLLRQVLRVRRRRSRRSCGALAVIGVLASVVGAYYYLRIVKIMFFDEPKEKFLAVPAKAGLVMGLAGLFVLLYVVWPAPLVDAAPTRRPETLF